MTHTPCRLGAVFPGGPRSPPSQCPALPLKVQPVLIACGQNTQPSGPHLGMLQTGAFGTLLPQVDCATTSVVSAWSSLAKVTALDTVPNGSSRSTGGSAHAPSAAKPVSEI